MYLITSFPGGDAMIEGCRARYSACCFVESAPLTSREDRAALGTRAINRTNVEKMTALAASLVLPSCCCQDCFLLLAS